MLYSYFRMVWLLLHNQIFPHDSIFKEALIQKSLYVCRLALASVDTVDMSIFSL